MKPDFTLESLKGEKARVLFCAADDTRLWCILQPASDIHWYEVHKSGELVLSTYPGGSFSYALEQFNKWRNIE